MRFGGCFPDSRWRLWRKLSLPAAWSLTARLHRLPGLSWWASRPTSNGLSPEAFWTSFPAFLPALRRPLTTTNSGSQHSLKLHAAPFFLLRRCSGCFFSLVPGHVVSGSIGFLQFWSSNIYRIMGFSLFPSLFLFSFLLLNGFLVNISRVLLASELHFVAPTPFSALIVVHGCPQFSAYERPAALLPYAPGFRRPLSAFLFTSSRSSLASAYRPILRFCGPPRISRAHCSHTLACSGSVLLAIPV